MYRMRLHRMGLGLIAGFILNPVQAAEAVYLNIANMTVEVGGGTSPGTFNNTFVLGSTIDKVIDAPSADAIEFHNQQTHIWFTSDTIGGGLELNFDFGREYDLSVLHFWNYDGESYDVDDVMFTFFNRFDANVGSLSIQPALGTSPGIEAEDILLPAPLGVQRVSVFLSGTNRHVDFQNIGFTANVSAIPEPSSVVPIAIVAGLAGGRRRRSPSTLNLRCRIDRFKSIQSGYHRHRPM